MNKKNKNVIVSKLYKGNIPQNYTFKTLFVNNFCIVPMNSSFIGNSKEVKNMNYGNMTLNKNINNSINNIDKDKIYHPKFSHNNYMNPKKINMQKNFTNNLVMNIENKQKKNIKMNKNYMTNNTETSLLEFKSISYKNIYNNKNKQKNILNDDKILKDNGFNEEYYYTTMDFSNFDFAIYNNNNLQNTNKKHVKFDLTQNVSFIYNSNDYIYNRKISTKNNNTRIKNTIFKNYIFKNKFTSIFKFNHFKKKSKANHKKI
jgi:hypothetical protein